MPKSNEQRSTTAAATCVQTSKFANKKTPSLLSCYLFVGIVETEPEAFRELRLILALGRGAQVAAHPAAHQDGEQQVLERNAKPEQGATLFAS
jgi:hypothetical protein